MSWGAHQCEPLFPTLQPSTKLAVLGRPMGPAAPRRARGMSIALPKKQRRPRGWTPASRAAAVDHCPPRRQTPSRSWQPPEKQCKFTAWSEAQIKRDDDIKKHVQSTPNALSGTRRSRQGWGWPLPSSSMQGEGGCNRPWAWCTPRSSSQL